VTLLAGDLDGRAALIVSGVDLGATLDEQTDQLEATGAGGLLQRRDAALLTGIDVRAGVNQCAGDFRIGPGERGVERRHLKRVARWRVDVRAAGQQQLSRLATAKKAGQTERLKAVRGPRVRLRRIVRQQSVEPRRFAQRGSLVDSESVGAELGRQVFGIGPLAALQRVEDG
jgi:hypothetical protein